MESSAQGPVNLANDLAALVKATSPDGSAEELLRRGLDWLARICPYDLATLFVLEGQELVAKAARGRLADGRVLRHRLSLARFPSVKEAMQARRARVFTQEDHAHGDGDPFDGVLDLPDGHACMVVPLFAGDDCLGLLTLDREVCEPYPSSVLNLVEVFGQALAAAIHGAEQKAALERLHLQDHAHAKLLEAELGGDAVGGFEASLNEQVRQLARQARQVAQTQTPVLIRGETGTGKERLARALHLWSPRADHPFVTLNCAAIPAGLLESELFGHLKGAFTGAARDRPGRFQMANGGTLLLDEVGELPLELQAKLLRVLQEGAFEPVGSDRTVKVDVRILAATHVDLERAIGDGRFREDLFYRLNVFPLDLPPLRERLEDLPQLCAELLSDQARRTGRGGCFVTPDGLARLSGYEWPGNVRELANVLERATILSPSRALGSELLELPGRRRKEARKEPKVALELLSLEELQRQHIQRVLEHTRGRIYGPGGAAEILGLKPSTLQSKMQKLGIARA